MLKPAGGGAESSVGLSIQQQLHVHTSEGSVPNFFDRWMEEYTYKVSPAEFRTRPENEEHTKKAESDEKSDGNGREKEFER
jgi:hypothetical protein